METDAPDYLGHRQRLRQRFERGGFEGHYRILVKVIDIFGNDTSQAFEVDVK